MDTEWTKISKIECLGEVDDYVYDLSIENGDPFFFANDVLVHNTDSCYFSANCGILYQLNKKLDLPKLLQSLW